MDIDCCNRALRGCSKGSVWSGKKIRTKVAVTEPLERGLRAQFGQVKNPWTLIAVIEPLEGALKALFGQ